MCDESDGEKDDLGDLALLYAEDGEEEDLEDSEEEDDPEKDIIAYLEAQAARQEPAPSQPPGTGKEAAGEAAEVAAEKPREAVGKEPEDKLEADARGGKKAKPEDELGAEFALGDDEESEEEEENPEDELEDPEDWKEDGGEDDAGCVKALAAAQPREPEATKEETAKPDLEMVESQATEALERSDANRKPSPAEEGTKPILRPKGKAKAKARGKCKAWARAKAASLVAKPESMPAKPPNSYQIFCSELQAEGKVGTRPLFAALAQDERTRFEERVSVLRSKYNEDMARFMSSKDGKQYKRQLESVSHKQKVTRAKEKLRESMPPRPLSAFMLYVAGSKGESGLPAQRWGKLSEDQRQPWNREHQKQLEEYSKAMEKFRTSASYRKFERTTKRKSKTKAKAKAKAKRALGGHDADMPKRPTSPFALYVKTMRHSGKGDSATLAKSWADLGPAGQKKYIECHQAAKAAFDKEMELRRKAPKGEEASPAENRLRKRNIEQKAKDTGFDSSKRNVEQKAKDTGFDSSNPPQLPDKPKTAKFIFLEERRRQVLKEDPSAAGSAREMAVKLLKEWEGLPAESKKVYQNKECSLLEDYNLKMDQYKRYEAFKSKGRGRGQGRGRGGRGAAGKQNSDALSFNSSDDEMGSDASSSSAPSD